MGSKASSKGGFPIRDPVSKVGSAEECSLMVFLKITAVGVKDCPPCYQSHQGISESSSRCHFCPSLCLPFILPHQYGNDGPTHPYDVLWQLLVSHESVLIP